MTDDPRSRAQRRRDAEHRLTATQTARLGLGHPRDVSMIEGEVEVLEIDALPQEPGDRFAARAGFDPRAQATSYHWFRAAAARDKGNTVLVVEHEPDTIAIADHVVDLGPGAGTSGGTVCFEGTVEGLRVGGTVTGRHLDDRAALKETVRTPTGTLEIRGATAHNLRDVDVDVPLGVLVVVTGVAGSGKSSLVHGSIPAGAGVVSIDQVAIRGSRRSNPATYSGLLDPIRNAFAKANGVKPALFSANSEGACPNCNGAGVIYTDLAMMAGVATICEECEGKRFQASVLDHHLGGRDISEVLAMSVTEADHRAGRLFEVSGIRLRSTEEGQQL